MTVARRAEEEEEEKVAAPGDRLKLKAMGMELEMVFCFFSSCEL